MSTNAQAVAALNDWFRESGAGVTLTLGIQMMPDLMGLLDAVHLFDGFSGDNDPYGEHDFGQMIWHGRMVFWKIDYYDQDLERWEDPASPRCRRVLTVMLASEY